MGSLPKGAAHLALALRALSPPRPLDAARCCAPLLKTLRLHTTQQPLPLNTAHAARPESRARLAEPLDSSSSGGGGLLAEEAPAVAEAAPRAAAGSGNSWAARLARAAAALLRAARGAAAAAPEGPATSAGAAAAFAAARDFDDGDDPRVRAHWAVLVAGSSGWGNYRHQADVYHAYRVLRRGGLAAKRIITLAYDDIAGSELNPFSGKVFNAPGGPDVYAGVAIDYRGRDVTAATLLAVLAGDARAVARRGTGRVLRAGPRDRVFLFYSDHGAAGVLGMPEGPFLYADQLHGVLRRRAREGGFKELVA